VCGGEGCRRERTFAFPSGVSLLSGKRNAVGLVGKPWADALGENTRCKIRELRIERKKSVKVEG
jgi:hypothetical protein